MYDKQDHFKTHEVTCNLVAISFHDNLLKPHLKNLSESRHAFPLSGHILITTLCVFLVAIMEFSEVLMLESI